MPRRHPDEMKGANLAPLCIAVRNSEAGEIEEALDRAGIDYTFEITPVIGKSVLSIVFGSTKTGVMFLVPEDKFEAALETIEQAGLGRLVVE